ncbi:PHA synthase subunit PhaC [Massilia genomosp. 1]|uniref:PHA synthase subunit PhaC n=1 Tax=Massilia genomosp. 1 TaxID=2609280 RepID=A0ABX0MY26_9BURK|nr:PHA synthase subunit PhaC [Massilia genomosp. 1]NHZ64507.1 PHA synthase subunit PhaC [Massilia genomosp. 1]
MTTLELLGFGPRQTPSRIVFSAPGLRLRCYGAGTRRHPPLLIVPAPIKRCYVWHLAPGHSVVRQALARGVGVYLIEWTELPARAGMPGLADYAGPLIDACVKVIQRRNACVQVALFGHALGGVLAALHSAWRPGHVAALALFEAPINVDGLAPLVRLVTGTALLASLPSERGRPLPGSLLSAIFANAAPAAFYAGPAIDVVASAPFPGLLATHLRVRRWTLDKLPMSRALFDDALALLFAHNSFMHGDLVLNGTRLDPGQVRAPLLSLYRPLSALVPPGAVLGFHEAAGSAHKVLLPYLGDVGVALQHVGALVGAGAHQLVWPRVFDWLERLGPLSTARAPVARSARLRDAGRRGGTWPGRHDRRPGRASRCRRHRHARAGSKPRPRSCGAPRP